MTRPRRGLGCGGVSRIGCPSSMELRQLAGYWVRYVSSTTQASIPPLGAINWAFYCPVGLRYDHEHGPSSTPGYWPTARDQR